MIEKTIKLNSNEEAIELYGPLDETLRHVETEYDVKVSARNHRLKVTGKKKDVEAAGRYLNARLAEIRATPAPKTSRSEPKPEGGKVYQPKEPDLKFSHRGRTIKPRSHNQEIYLEALATHDIVIGIGPAGTGKTYLAVASAVEHLKSQKVNRIIFTRPAVEAGESLGFLPGDMQEKVNPYLRPLYDALYEMMDFEEVARCMERGMIEVAPLAYMRGRTLNDAFIILDEGQNCTSIQMKMFLTRIGRGSKAVLTGDITQIDLPQGKTCGLTDALKILKSVEGIARVHLQEKDVVRHPLVRRIVEAYEKYES